MKRGRKREHERGHEVKVWKCEEEGCGWAGLTRGGLRGHQRVKHEGEGERKWECEECGKRFGYKVVRDRHVRRVHRSVGEDGQERVKKRRKKTEKERAFGGVELSEGGKSEGEEGQGEMGMTGEGNQMEAPSNSITVV